MSLFEYIDCLKMPYDIYMFNTSLHTLPHSAHWHYFVEILYIYEGKLVVELNNIPYKLSEGDLIYIYPQTVHSIYTVSNTHVRYGVVKFNLNRINLSTSYTPILKTLFSFAPITNPNDESTSLFVHFKAKQLASHDVKASVDRLIMELDSTPFCHDIIVNAHLCILLVSLSRIWQENGINLTEIASYRLTDNNFYNNIIEYIDLHSNEVLSVQELAQKSNMSYSNFARLFKKQNGRSCKEYIEYIKICKAQNMLLFTDFSLNYIASETGFTDCSHFIKSYKKHTGITPNQQRKLTSPQT